MSKSARIDNKNRAHKIQSKIDSINKTTIFEDHNMLLRKNKSSIVHNRFSEGNSLIARNAAAAQGDRSSGGAMMLNESHLQVNDLEANHKAHNIIEVGLD